MNFKPTITNDLLFARKGDINPMSSYVHFQARFFFEPDYLIF